MILAIDPGSASGAAVLVEGGDFGVAIRGVFAWEPGPKRRPGLAFRGAFVASAAGAVRVARLINQSRIVSGHQLGLVLEIALRGSGFTRVRVVVEDTYVGKSPKAAIGLARWTGAIAGALESVAVRPPEYVRADEWRLQAFGIPRFTKRDDAKAATIGALPAAVRARIDDFAPVVGGVEHLVDAVGVGLWASGLRVEPTPKPLAKRRGRTECS
jgi:hypothetical protein